jgi:transposase InsO family protein
MPWKAPAVSELRFALCHSVRTLHQPVAAAARRFGVSRKTAHKWLAVYDAEEHPCGAGALADRPRRPLHSPRRTAPDGERAVLEVRDRYNWGPRKIHHFLLARDPGADPPAEAPDPVPVRVPATRTIADILRRHGRVAPGAGPQPLVRFERSEPNQLWQIDFKGPLEVERRRVMPLSVLDDCSRYLLCFSPCRDRTMATAWALLWEVFGAAGLPVQVLTDNGFNTQGGPSPGLGWFDSRLIRLGIRPAHGRPYHPQTQGKVERLHGSSCRELIGFDARLDRFEHFARDCERWRAVYNALRPHEALGDRPPVSRWRPSPTPRPPELPDPESFYPPGSVLRKVGSSGDVRFNRWRILAGRGIAGDTVRVEQRQRQIVLIYCWKPIRAVPHESLKPDTML